MLASQELCLYQRGGGERGQRIPCPPEHLSWSIRFLQIFLCFFFLPVSHTPHLCMCPCYSGRRAGRALKKLQLAHPNSVNKAPTSMTKIQGWACTQKMQLVELVVRLLNYLWNQFRTHLTNCKPTQKFRFLHRKKVCKCPALPGRNVSS